METQSVVLVGVGGQGILLASEIIARTVMESGLDVKMNEIHGMAQRGGSVVAQIRYGEQVASPLIPKGTARVLVALEKIEAMRHRDFLSSDGLAIVSDQEIIPITASSGQVPYPAVGEEEFSAIFSRLVWVSAVEMASELGNTKAANTILLGALSNGLEFAVEHWETAIRTCVKPRFVDVNMKAFELGRGLKTQ